jgi:UDP-N-acetylglucosamine 4,6-dehydratase
MTTLVTGGTGSFGKAFLRSVQGPVRVLSRDEEKQRRLALLYPDAEYVIGDVRDRDAVRHAMRGVTRVFHAAALKQVPQAEANPSEAVKTNIIGTENVCLVANETGARVVLLSTDKAVEPVGVMGATKMVAERIAVALGANVVRYGNVVGSRGSIVPMWRAQMARGEPVTVTALDMTRFLITLDEAIELVHTAMVHERTGLLFARKSPAATVAQMVRVMAGGRVEVIGVRPGEKYHEHLVLPHEGATDAGTHFIIDPNAKRSGITYSSETAPRVSDTVLAAMIEAAPDDDL